MIKYFVEKHKTGKNERSGELLISSLLYDEPGLGFPVMAEGVLTGRLICLS